MTKATPVPQGNPEFGFLGLVLAEATAMSGCSVSAMLGRVSDELLDVVTGAGALVVLCGDEDVVFEGVLDVVLVPVGVPVV
jgi:hypothetical protein